MSGEKRHYHFPAIDAWLSQREDKLHKVGVSPKTARVATSRAYKPSSNSHEYLVGDLRMVSTRVLLVRCSSTVIIQSPQPRKPLDRVCAHAGDGKTYLVRVDSMS